MLLKVIKGFRIISDEYSKHQYGLAFMEAVDPSPGMVGVHDLEIYEPVLGLG